MIYVLGTAAINRIKTMQHLLKQKKFQLGITLLLLAAGGTWHFFKKSNNGNDKAIFKTDTPTQQHITQYVSASGTLKAKDQISVGSLVAGKVENILVDDNDNVKKGQLLVKLDNGIGETAVQEAQAGLIQAQAKATYYIKRYARNKKIYDAGQLSSQAFDKITFEYDAAKADVLQAQARLAREKMNYTNLSITSPDNGVIIAKKVNLGQMITSQLDAKVLFEIAKDLKEMEAHVDIDEADVGMVKEKQEAFFTVDAFPDKRFSSTIRQVQYEGVNNDNIITYNTVFDVANPSYLLRPGMTINVDIKVADRKDALAVPNKALRINSLKLNQYCTKANLGYQRLQYVKGRQNKPESLWIQEGKTVKEVAVVLGAANEKYTQVLKGITSSTQVVVEFMQPTDSSAFLQKAFGKG